MEIKEITRFKFDGKEYDSLEAIKTEIENRIGKIIDYADVTLTPKQKLSIHTAIIKNRIELNKLLNVTFESHSLGGYQTRNILDSYEG